ncbi:MAG: hypothetical protein H0V68_03970 [Actinobacteria bacterium]|nr:hypothetical protein [Actinomycetota bacterium]
MDDQSTTDSTTLAEDDILSVDGEETTPPGGDADGDDTDTDADDADADDTDADDA